MAYEVKWTPETIEVYKYESTIEFIENDYVIFKNNSLPLGVSIVKWISNPPYHFKRSILEVPLLKKGWRYKVILNIEMSPESSVLMVFDFFDFKGKKISSKTFSNGVGSFVYPWRAYFYSISLNSIGVKKFIFKNIEISKT